MKIEQCSWNVVRIFIGVTRVVIVGSNVSVFH